MPGGLRDQDRRLFAEELRALRRQRLWSQEDLGTRINFSGSTIANIESGYRAPTREQARLLDEVFGTPGTFQRLEGRIRNVPFSAGFRPFQPYEAQARTLKWFEHTLVPGLLQTEDYARAMLSSDPDAGEGDVKARLEARMERKLIFERKDPPRLYALLDEHVLHPDPDQPTDPRLINTQKPGDFRDRKQSRRTGGSSGLHCCPLLDGHGSWFWRTVAIK